MISILTYIALTCAAILVLLLLLSIISGLDLDLDMSGADAAGGLGPVKGLLAFLALGAWVVRLFLLSRTDPWLAFLAGTAAGLAGVWLLSWMLRFLLSQQSNVNWSVADALLVEGTVYLKIPADGEGIVRIPVGGTYRELKARASNQQEIPTGARIIVSDLAADGILLVMTTEEAE